MHFHTHTNTRACTCAFACACARERERGEGGEGEWCWVGRCGVCGVLSVQTLNGFTLKGFFGEPLKHVITHMWAIHGKQKIVDKR